MPNGSRQPGQVRTSFTVSFVPTATVRESWRGASLRTRALARSFFRRRRHARGAHGDRAPVEEGCAAVRTRADARRDGAPPCSDRASRDCRDARRGGTRRGRFGTRNAGRPSASGFLGSRRAAASHHTAGSACVSLMGSSGSRRGAELPGFLRDRLAALEAASPVGREVKAAGATPQDGQRTKELFGGKEPHPPFRPRRSTPRTAPRVPPPSSRLPARPQRDSILSPESLIAGSLEKLNLAKD